jgi:DNA-binding MarR family transcriptional regulator
MAQQRDADLGIVDALAQLSFLVQGTLTKQGAKHDLSIIQTRLLGVLRDREPTMQELARLLDLDKSSVTGLIDRAERRGYVRRVPSREDRRTVHVRLSPAGRRLVDKVAAAFQSDITAATACLTPAESARLSTLATRVVTTHTATQAVRG